MNTLLIRTLLTSIVIGIFHFSAVSQGYKGITTDVLDMKNTNHVFISAHRGAWRNAPENSLKSLKDAIDMGVDIVEADLKKTKDGHLVVMHDMSIDRTTNGKGLVKDYTLKELKSFYLKDQNGHHTHYKIPTFGEFLVSAKGRIMVVIDHAFGYYPDVIEQLKEHEMMNQSIINVPHISKNNLYGKNLELIDSIAIMVIVSSVKADVKDVIKSYEGRKRTIIHPTFKSDTLQFVKWMPAVRDMSLALWLNALWPHHNGGHDDDRAYIKGERDESWGWLIKQGKASIVQSDRPKELILYLQQKGFRHKKFRVQ